MWLYIPVHQFGVNNINKEKQMNTENTETKAESTDTKPDNNVMLLIVALPFIGTALNFFYVGGMSLLQNPAGALSNVMIGIIIISAILVGKDAADNKLKENGHCKTSSFAWGICTLFLYLIIMPVYARVRGKATKSRFLLPAILGMILFIGSSAMMNSVIEDQKTSVRRSFSNAVQDFDNEMANAQAEMQREMDKALEELNNIQY